MGNRKKGINMQTISENMYTNNIGKDSEKLRDRNSTGVVRLGGPSSRSPTTEEHFRHKLSANLSIIHGNST
jgi:hypothetical protein